jgi:hypothetical protein
VRVVSPRCVSSPVARRVQIVTIDPFGHIVLKEFQEYLEKGYDIRPTIAGACIARRRNASVSARPRGSRDLACSHQGAHRAR